MSGNYDYPPAYRRPARTGDSQQRPLRPSLQHLRNLLIFERRRGNLNSDHALETLNQEMEGSRSDTARDTERLETLLIDRQIQQLQSDLNGREERIRRLILAGSPPTVDPAVMNRVPASLNPAVSTAVPSRRRGLRHYQTETRDSAPPPPRSASMFSGPLERPHDAPSRPPHPAGLAPLDDPIPVLDSIAPPVVPNDTETDRDSDGRRAKRRKLESDDGREGLRGFSYGQYGQVVPGQLKMEIVSCDGGSYQLGGSNLSWPENVLRNDDSVYCTKSDRCNMILRHRGETPFCLKKIVIKAPRSGFDSPVQEGMVFVSMTSDQLLARTAQYKIRYQNSRRRRRHTRSDTLPSQEYLNAFRPPPRSSRELTVLAGPDSDCESEHEAATGTAVTNNVGLVGEFRVTTSYDDHSDAEGSGESLDINDSYYPFAAEPERPPMDQVEDDLLCPESNDSESDADTAELNNDVDQSHLDERRLLDLPRISNFQFHVLREFQRRMRMRYAEIDRRQASDREPYSGTTHSERQPCEVMKPHARFFIERGKNMVSIKFDPPPSGRFILVKLWNPSRDGNVDIQSIVAHGFAGPRFFPATSLR